MTEHNKTSMWSGELSGFLIRAFPAFVFICISFLVRNVFLTFGAFVILFLLMWAFAFVSGRYSGIAISCILLAFSPVKSFYGMSFGGMWLYLSFCIFILTGRNGAVLRALNWKVLGMFIIPAVASFIVNAGGNTSLFIESLILLDNMSPIVMGPIFFSLTFRDPEEKLNGILFIMISILMFYLIVVSLGRPQLSLEEPSVKSGYAMSYILWGQGISMIRTQVGIILSIISATSFVLIVEKKRVFASYMIFFAGILGIIWGGGRGTFVALLLTICIYISLNLRHSGYFMAGIVATVTLFVGALTFSSQVETAYNRWLSRWNLTSGETLDNGRVMVWNAAIDQIEREPFGVGRWTLNMKTGPFINYIHNDYLSRGVSYGILGVFAYAFVMLYAFISLYIASKKSTDSLERVIAGATLSAVCCLAINSFTDHLSADSTRYLLAWFIVGIGWSIADKRCRRIVENYV